MLKRLLFPLVCLAALAASPSFARDSWTIRKTLNAGETIDIQTMYFVNSETCVPQDVPPKPSFARKPKLGKVTFSSGKHIPHQCPSIKLNANFAKYTAGANPGKDRFNINWTATEKPKRVFRVIYVITIK